MNRFSRPRSRGRRAAAAVEAAVVLPILVLFLVASIDLGRLAKISDCLSNGARNGAQYGSANTTAAADSAHIRAAAVTEMTNLPNVSSTNPTVTATQRSYTANNVTTNFIEVTVT